MIRIAPSRSPCATANNRPTTETPNVIQRASPVVSRQMTHLSYPISAVAPCNISEGVNADTAGAPGSGRRNRMDRSRVDGWGRIDRAAVIGINVKAAGRSDQNPLIVRNTGQTESPRLSASNIAATVQSFVIGAVL